MYLSLFLSLTHTLCEDGRIWRERGRDGGGGRLHGIFDQKGKLDLGQYFPVTTLHLCKNTHLHFVS